MKKDLWIQRFLELLSRRVSKGISKRISQRAGLVCQKYANEHQEETMGAWNKGQRGLKNER